MKGEKKFNVIAQFYEVHPNQVSAWKEEIITNVCFAIYRVKRINADDVADV